MSFAFVVLLVYFGDGGHAHRLDVGHQQRNDPRGPTAVVEQMREEASWEVRFQEYAHGQRISMQPSYYIALSFCSVCLFASIIYSHRERLKKRDIPSEDYKKHCSFVTFLRPRPDQGMPDGGYFNAVNCPPPPQKTLQLAASATRSSFWNAVFRHMPGESIVFAAIMSYLTGLVWLLIFMAVKKGFLKDAYMNWHGDGLEVPDFWHAALKSLGSIAAVIKYALAFMLVLYVRSRLQKVDQLKIAVWRAQQSVEMVAFVCGSFLSGESEEQQRFRHEIYRWLSCAFFFNCRALNWFLQEVGSSDLVEAGVLSAAEEVIVTKAVCEDGPPKNDQGQLCPSDPPLPHVAEQNVKTSCARVRDLLLWWIEIRVQAMVKEGVVDKDKLKKIMGAIWRSRDLMENLLQDSSWRHAYLWSILMQVFVDLFIASLPFQVLAEQFVPHIWLLPFCMVQAFLVTLFYDSLMQMNHRLADPFGASAGGWSEDDLTLDPVIVAAERSCFSNLGLSDLEDLPEPLRSSWAAAKLVKDDAKKDKKKDGGDK